MVAVLWCYVLGYEHCEGAHTFVGILYSRFNFYIYVAQNFGLNDLKF